MQIRRLCLRDDLDRAAMLTYDADPILYGSWLGGRETVLPLLSQLIAREDNWFSYKLTLGCFKKGELVGLINGMLPREYRGMDLNAAMQACAPRAQYAAIRARTDEFMSVLADFSHAAYIQSLCVMPAYRGRQIATQLLQAFLDYAKRSGESKACLEVSDYHPNAKRLYEHLGFRVVGSAQSGAAGITVEQMEKDL